MTKQRRVFSAEFKREATDLVLKQNYSFIEASRSLGTGESVLRRWWVGQLQQKRTGVTPQSKALPPEKQKNQELEARIASRTREIDTKKGYRTLDVGRSRAYALIHQLSVHELVDRLCQVFEIPLRLITAIPGW